MENALKVALKLHLTQTISHFFVCAVESQLSYSDEL